MGRIDQQNREILLQEIEHRPPIDPRAFHRHMGHLVGPHPIMQNPQIHGQRQERLNLLEDFAPFSNQKAGHHSLFVNIQTTTPLVNHFHPWLLSSSSPGDILHLKNLICVLSAEWEATVWGTLGHPGHISYGLNGTKSKPTFCHGDNLRKYNTTIFMVRGCPPGMGISLKIALFSLSPGACLREAPPPRASCGGQALRRRQGRDFTREMHIPENVKRWESPGRAGGLPNC